MFSGGEEREEIAWSLVWRDLVLCSELEEDLRLRAVVGCFVEVCMTKSLKVNAR